MTIFLCVLTLLMASSVKIKSADGHEAANVAAFALYIVMVLGLATLACWSWWVR